VVARMRAIDHAIELISWPSTSTHYSSIPEFSSRRQWRSGLNSASRRKIKARSQLYITILIYYVGVSLTDRSDTEALLCSRQLPPDYPWLIGRVHASVASPRSTANARVRLVGMEIASFFYAVCLLAALHDFFSPFYDLQ
jgi:hypothetical protein